MAHYGTWALVFAIALACCIPGQAQTLFGATGGAAASNLYSINPATGAATSIGSIGFAVSGLAVHPATGVLYGATSARSPGAPRSLITINKTTGAGTLVGAIGGTVADIAFNSSGVLYGWTESGDDLVTINLTTGARTVIANAGISTFGSGLAFSPAGTLFFTGNGSSGALRTVNPTTGITTIVATLTGSPIAGALDALAFNSAGVLFGVVNTFGTGATFLVTINTATAVMTSIGSSVNRLDAIAFDAGGGCPPHRIHGHISTVPPDHSGNSHEHHGQHGHTVVSYCPPHVPGHVLVAAGETEFVAALNEDGSLNAAHAAPRGTVLQLFGSAAGLFLDNNDLNSALGFTPPADADLYYTTRLPDIQIGGTPAPVLFSGLAPGLTGVWQINVLVPFGTPVGKVPVSISYGENELRSVELEIR